MLTFHNALSLQTVKPFVASGQWHAQSFGQLRHGLARIGLKVTQKAAVAVVKHDDPRNSDYGE
jgi:hypothetical protein